MSMTLVVMTAGKGSRFGGMKKIARIGPSGEALVVTYADDVAAVRDEIAALVAAGRYPPRLWR